MRLLALALVLFAATASAEPKLKLVEPRVETRWNVSLMASGAVALAAAWLTAATVAYAAADDALVAPLAGPFVYLARHHLDGPRAGLLITDGLVQAAGLALAVIGFFVASPVVVAPAPLAGGAGLAAAGHF